MSVVIAVKDKKKKCIYVGCDSQVTTGNSIHSLNGESTKIWNHKLNKIIIGGVGSLRDIQLVQTNEDMIEDMAIIKHQVDYKYMVSKFYTDLYELMRKYNRVTVNKDGNYSSDLDDSFIVAFDNNAWAIGVDGAVLEIDDYLVIGSGQEVATGVLEANKNLKPEERIRKAIKACADTTTFVNNKIKILNTGGNIK